VAAVLSTQLELSPAAPAASVLVALRKAPLIAESAIAPRPKIGLNFEPLMRASFDLPALHLSAHLWLLKKNVARDTGPLPFLPPSSLRNQASIDCHP
jgi:hypothetical protein